MQEVLTKSFWQSVKKTFHEALEGRPVEGNASKALPDNPPDTGSDPEVSAPPERDAGAAPRA